MAEREVSGWVWSQNVRPLLRWTAFFVGYRFDDSDWQAVEQALEMTDSESADGWYEYPLVGDALVVAGLARGRGRPRPHPLPWRC